MSLLLAEHFNYLSDSVRLDCYRRACEALIETGDVVADLGCGLGILGLFSLKAGAGHVYAVDAGPIIEFTRTTIAKAALKDRVTLLHGRVQHTALPEPADLIICDHVGYFGFDYGIIELMQYGRQHMLKSGGKLIPARLELEVAAVSSNELSELMSCWQQPAMPSEYHWLTDYAMNETPGRYLGKQDMLSDAVKLADIDLAVEEGQFFSWTTKVTVKRDGVLNGLGAWFRAQLAPDVWMTNSPLADQPIHRRQMFLAAGNIAVKEGDVIKVAISVRPTDNLIAWDLELPDGETISHSSWQGMMLRTGEVAQLQQDHVPSLNALGKARRVVSGYCDGVRTMSQIQEIVCTNHPELFPSEAEILRFVVRVLGRDTN